MSETTTAPARVWSQPCQWCGHACSVTDDWCPDCGHRAHSPRLYCDCGRKGCMKRDPSLDYKREVDARASETPAMSDEQLAEAKRLLDEAQQRATEKREDRH
jgi:hypothetical protein